MIHVSTLAGFLNIDCGATESYVDPLTQYTWVPDTPYISTGKTFTLVVPASLQNFTELKTLRYFDDPRPEKYCYTLPVTPGSIYLLRATFFYGNYDNANQPLSFQVAVDATVVDTVTSTANSGDGMYYTEYLYVAQGKETYLCFIRTSASDVPFVSGISLKLATELSAGFDGNFGGFLKQGVIMKTITRVNYGGTRMIRYA